MVEGAPVDERRRRGGGEAGGVCGLIAKASAVFCASFGNLRTAHTGGVKDIRPAQLCAIMQRFVTSFHQGEERG